MGVITGAQLIALVDSIAAQLTILDTAVGTETTAASILYGMQQNVDRIDAYGEEDPRVALEGVASGMKDLMASFKIQLDQLFSAEIENHIRRQSDLSFSEYWAQENSDRIPPEFASMFRGQSHFIAPALVWPAYAILGSFVVSGAGAGIFTDGDAIDLLQYGAADLQAEVLVAATTVTLVATITGLDQNGSVMTGTATFVAANVGDKVDVVPDVANAQFADITDISITGGAATDAFRVQVKADRTPSL